MRTVLRVRVRRFDAKSVPVGGRDAWLFARWAEVDDWIARSQAAEVDEHGMGGSRREAGVAPPT